MRVQKQFNLMKLRIEDLSKLDKYQMS